MPEPADTSHIAPQKAEQIRPYKFVRRRHLIPIEVRRLEFFEYCKKAAWAAKARARKAGLPCDIDPGFLERMLVEQKYRCAISGIELELPRLEKRRAFHRNAFGPSLDRIEPGGGYVRDNVRITSNIVNTAMNEWGPEALMKLVKALAAVQFISP